MWHFNPPTYPQGPAERLRERERERRREAKQTEDSKIERELGRHGWKGERHGGIETDTGQEPREKESGQRERKEPTTQRLGILL